MQTFSDGREAKEFLVSAIVTEAEREGVSMSEVETKMLYFTETAWTLQNILEVNEAFDLEYDQAEYEDKIVGLIRGFREHARRHSPADLSAWDEAVRVLRKEDHYLLVMVDLASSLLGTGRLPKEGTMMEFIAFRT